MDDFIKDRNVIQVKPVVKNFYDSVDKTNFISALFEIIDDIEHNGTSEILIKYMKDTYYKEPQRHLIIGLNKNISKENMDDLLSWFKSKEKSNSMATRGMGSNYLFAVLRCELQLVSIMDDETYLIAEQDEYNLYESSLNKDISDNTYNDRINNEWTTWTKKKKSRDLTKFTDNIINETKN